MSADPMTLSPDPLTKEEREATMRWTVSVLGSNGRLPADRVAHAKDVRRYEATLRELESRSQVPVPMPVPDTHESAARSLYEKLKEASDMFAVLRMEPHFTTPELDDLVALAGHAKDVTNRLRAQRDVAESRVLSPEEATTGKRDAERLDWLESFSAAVCSTENGGVVLRVLPTAANTPGDCADDCEVETRGSHWTPNVEAPTLREAIDAAPLLSLSLTNDTRFQQCEIACQVPSSIAPRSRQRRFPL